MNTKEFKDHVNFFGGLASIVPLVFTLVNSIASTSIGIQEQPFRSEPWPGYTEEISTFLGILKFMIFGLLEVFLALVFGTILSKLASRRLVFTWWICIGVMLISAWTTSFNIGWLFTGPESKTSDFILLGVAALGVSLWGILLHAILERPVIKIWMPASPRSFVNKKLVVFSYEWVAITVMQAVVYIILFWFIIEKK